MFRIRIELCSQNCHTVQAKFILVRAAVPLPHSVKLFDLMIELFEYGLKAPSIWKKKPMFACVCAVITFQNIAFQRSVIQARLRLTELNNFRHQIKELG